MPLEGDPFAIAKVLRAGSEVHEDSKEVGNRLLGAIEKVLINHGRGRIYTTGFFTGKDRKVHPIGTRPAHQASAPGDPPAMDTAELVNSFSADTARLPNGSEVQVGSKSKVAAWMEYGTKKILPRPFFRVTVLKMLPKLGEPWAKGIERRERAMARKLGGTG